MTNLVLEPAHTLFLENFSSGEKSSEDILFLEFPSKKVTFEIVV